MFIFFPTFSTFDLFFILLVYAIIIGIVLLWAGLIFMMASGAVVFSRVSFSMLVALALINTAPVLVPESGFWNYAAWCIVTMSIVFLLSVLPRSDLAMRFFCTVFMSQLIVELSVLIIADFLKKGQEPFQIGIAGKLLIKAICVGISILFWVRGERKAEPKTTHPVLLWLDRLTGSLIYGVTAVSLYILSEGQSIPIALGILLVSTALAVAADMLLPEKKLPVCTTSGK